MKPISSRVLSLIVFSATPLVSFGVGCVLAAMAALLLGGITARSFSLGLFLSAILAVLLGAARITSLGIGRDSTYQLAQSVSQTRQAELIRREFEGAFRGGRFLVQMVMVALGCLALGFLVESAGRELGASRMTFV